MMRSVVLTHTGFLFDRATETFLLSALAGLGRACDSLLSCRVHLEGGNSQLGRRKPFCVTLSLNTTEHNIVVKMFDGTNNALTARDAIRGAVTAAESELRELKLTSKCTTCCDQASFADSGPPYARSAAA
jgi:hypothetical protein